MDKLLTLGFVKSAEFRDPENGIFVDFLANRDAKNILYAIVCLHEGSELGDSRVIYIGHAGGDSSFGKRMGDYRQGSGESTNNRVHKAIVDHLRAGPTARCFAYCMPDHFGMSAHGLHIDVAAGLEKSLIRHYATFNREVGHGDLINKAGNKWEPGTADTTKSTSAAPSSTFEYHLGKTYWRIPSINVPSNLSARFGPDGAVATAELMTSGQVVSTLQTDIDRTANSNGSPRLYFAGDEGEEFQRWKHENFKEGDCLQVTIIGDDHIQVSTS